MNYLYLVIAIVAEVVATSALKASEGSTRLFPTLLAVVGYGIAFYLLSIILKSIPVGITYAIWSGLGIVLVTIVGQLIYGQKLDGPAILGMSFIVAGVVVINLFSKSVVH